MNRVGLCSVTFRDLAPMLVIERANAAGVEAIEWAGERTVDHDEPERMAKIGEASRSSGIAASSYGSYVRAGTAGAREHFEIALDAASALGAGNMRVWAGDAARAEVSDADYAQAVDDMALMAKECALREITLSVEYHRRTLTEHADDAVALFDAVNSENLFSYWQPVPDRGLAIWEQELDLLAPYLSDLHVFHWVPGEGADERRPLVEGTQYWQALMNKAQRSDRWPHPATAYLEFVHDGSERQFQEDMTVLRKLCRLASQSL